MGLDGVLMPPLPHSSLRQWRAVALVSLVDDCHTATVNDRENCWDRMAWLRRLNGRGNDSSVFAISSSLLASRLFDNRNLWLIAAATTSIGFGPVESLFR